MPKTLCINFDAIPRCPHAAENKTHTKYLNDGAHDWTNGKQTGRCLYEYTCTNCGLVMVVDSSD